MSRGRPRSRRGVAGALVLAVLTLVGCTTSVEGSGRRGNAAASSAPTSGASGAPPSAGTTAPSAQPAGTCGAYAEPDANRPRVTLDFTVAPDHATVTGTERISFTPDLDITELVFRLTANTAPSVEQGNGITVTAATADHGGGAATYEAAGAATGSQGGLLHLPFAAPVPAGTTVTAQLTFSLTLGQESFDRFGRDGNFAWFGSGQPLLAWERGVGWHTEPMLQFTAESATSEAMNTTLRVTAPASDTVIMSGDPAAPPAGGSTRTWTSTVDAARDVSVAVGPFVTSDTTVDAGRAQPAALRVGAPDQQSVDALVPEFDRALTSLAAQFGPYPFPSLSVARLPSRGGGIEYPSSILMLDGSRLVAVHETAHQWFYAMVGDSQAEHAWLDEAFASFGEQVVNGDPPPGSVLTQLPGPVDKPTASYGANEGTYYRTTYDKGSAALFAARDASGAAPFDQAIRCYVARNAWRIANPPDLAAALADLPGAITALQQAGALAP